MNEHSRYAPSSAFRWVNCPGSIPLGEEFPDLFQHPAGPEGTAAHWVWEVYKVMGAWPLVGDITPNGVAVTEDMLEGGQEMIDKVLELLAPHGLNLHSPQVRSEERVAIPFIHPQCFGTPDWEVDLLELTGEYHVLDYKFGHRSVSAFEMWQCVAYLRGACDRLGLSYDQRMNAKFIIHVVQPRCFHGKRYDRWETTGAYLEGAMWPELKEAAYRVSDQEMGAPRFAGTWCGDCPGRRGCPTLRRNAGAVMDWLDHSYPHQLSPEDAGHELSFIEHASELLEAYRTGIKAQVEYDIGQNRPNSYFAMLPSSAGKLKWNAPFAEVIAAADLVEVNIRKPEEPITPTQAIKKFKEQGLDDSVIAEYSARVPGGMTLKPKTESLALKAFGAN